MNRFLGIVLLLMVTILMCLCTNGSLAIGSDNPDFKVIGTVMQTNGLPASKATVRLLPASYNPVTDMPVPGSMIDTTDSNGHYSFSLLKNGNYEKGMYSIEAVSDSRTNRLLITNIDVAGDSTIVPTDTLRLPGKIILTLPPGMDTLAGFAYIPGTDISVPFGGDIRSVTIDSVPTGRMPPLCFKANNDSVSNVLRYDVLVPPGGSVTISNMLWRYSKRLYFNTTASGADVAGDVLKFPVLIRLSQSNFDFSLARADGGDIRLTKSDNTPLYFEIEQWDSSHAQAALWVTIDTIYGNSSSNFISIYWGNQQAMNVSNSAAVFDTSAGFQGVWHFAEAGNVMALDATVNHYNGTPTGMSAAASVSGAIGNARNFNGMSSYLTMFNTSVGKLNFPENGYYSVSAWVNTNVLDSQFHGIVYKSNWQYGLQIRPENTWQFFEYDNFKGWSGTFSAAVTGLWTLVTGVQQGTKQYLYVNGSCVDSVITLDPSTKSRTAFTDLQVGHCPDGGQDPDRFFNGIIDEVRIQNIALNADWIKLCYMNQKQQDVLTLLK